MYRGLYARPASFRLGLPLNRAQRRFLQSQSRLRSTRPSPNSPFDDLFSRASRRRYNSTQPTRAVASAGLGIARYIYATGLLVVFSAGYLYITDTRAGLHQYLVPPLLRTFVSDAEQAHHTGVDALKLLYSLGVHPRERSNDDEELGDLRVEVFGHVLNNPVGTSAGIDKDGEIPSALLALGGAVVEVGGITARPQEGNPQPRVFRIPSQNALINRYGLNSEGADHVAMTLRERVRAYAYDHGFGMEPASEQLVLDGAAGVPPGSLTPGKLMLVQVAKNKDTPDNDIEAIAQDYVYGVERLAKYADVIVVNVSSPNTPGLRDLQATAPLTAILSAVVDAAKSADRRTKPAVMVKVSPDEDSDEQIDGICTAVWNSGVDGVIVGNTTKKRPDPFPQGFVLPAKDQKVLTEMGGYSGPQMFQRTLDLVKRYRVKLDQGSASSEASTISSSSSSPPAISSTKPENSNTSRPDSEAITWTGNPTSSESQTMTKALKAADAEAIPPSQPSPEPTVDIPADVKKQIKDSTERDAARLKPLTQEAFDDSKQPLINLPSDPSDSEEAQKSTFPAASSPKPSSSKSVAPSQNTASPQSAKTSPSEPKVIFATGGITNGEQCLQILNAGASVCQVYTAMMYGGVGTPTRIKREMREIMHGGARNQ